MKQFSGNFWWTTADYYAGLRASTQMNKDYLGAIQCCFFVVENQAPGNPLNSTAGRCPLRKRCDRAEAAHRLHASICVAESLSVVVVSARAPKA